MNKQFLLVASLAALAASACSKSDEAPKNTPAAAAAAPQTAAAQPAEAAAEAAAEEEIAEVSVSELAGWRADGQVQVAVFDANGPDTRKSVGTIPGAVMLDDYANCKDQLPANREQKLVFYCYNEMCGASHAAAKVAVAGGFEQVFVLTAGIVGWKDAGQPVAQL